MIKTKQKLLVKISILLFIIITLSIVSFAYYTNINKWLDEQKTPYLGGEGQKRLSQDFIVNGCGTNTILDTVTGLCWNDNLNIAIERTWTSAMSDCDNLVHGGYNDWRLPERDELLSLVDLIGNRVGCESLSSLGFKNCIEAFYWSSNSYKIDTNLAWVVYLDLGGSDYTTKTIAGSRVACVRSHS